MWKVRVGVTHLVIQDKVCIFVCESVWVFVVRNDVGEREIKTNKKSSTTESWFVF